MGSKLPQVGSLLHLIYNRKDHSAANATPKGHFAVYIGENRRRFVLPTCYLEHPQFIKLLRRAEEEFGFHHQMGGLTIPCEEDEFMDLASQMCSKCIRAKDQKRK